MNKNIEKGYYWILLHPIFEEGWTVGYYTGEGWYLMCMEGLQDWTIINEVGEKLKEPPEKINYT